ncbi:hypothetical protein E2C01_044413 [Portunus trituberculatus]|uniref:Uncharacterized protein n=1 Tax=Portunus trituberculatus TaxID=210409 RepID=A0A5B7G290_PORTR|nr:hypothetical protein [Portunus trituberculatus]
MLLRKLLEAMQGVTGRGGAGRGKMKTSYRGVYIQLWSKGPAPRGLRGARHVPPHQQGLKGHLPRSDTGPDPPGGAPSRATPGRLGTSTPPPHDPDAQPPFRCSHTGAQRPSAP